ncbi:MAG: 50S ribosomal protein L13 [Chlamydiales bacterium]
MKKNKNETILLTKEKVKPNWLIFDASGKTLGRFASEIAKILRGKHRPDFTPHVDCGDGVIVINADKIKVTGAKEAQKEYFYYTGAVSGLRRIPYRMMKARKPEYIIRHAVEKMLPKTKLGNKQKKKLRIYAGENYEMKAQKPIKVSI